MQRLRLRAIRIVQNDRFQAVAMAVFLKMSSIGHFSGCRPLHHFYKTIRSSPETNINPACGGAPEEPHERHAAPAYGGTPHWETFRSRWLHMKFGKQ